MVLEKWDIKTDIKSRNSSTLAMMIIVMDKSIRRY